MCYVVFWMGMRDVFVKKSIRPDYPKSIGLKVHRVAGGAEGEKHTGFAQNHFVLMNAVHHLEDFG